MPNPDPISQCIETLLQQYFTDLDGEMPTGVYDMVLHRVELPLLTIALQQCEGNQSRTADMLGINRNTLRKKMQQYHLL